MTKIYEKVKVIFQMQTLLHTCDIWRPSHLSATLREANLFFCSPEIILSVKQELRSGWFEPISRDGFSRCAVCTALGEGAVLPLRPQGAAPALSILHQAPPSYWSTRSRDQMEASHWPRTSAGPQPRPLTGRELSKADIRTSKGKDKQLVWHPGTCQMVFRITAFTTFGKKCFTLIDTFYDLTTNMHMSGFPMQTSNQPSSVWVFCQNRPSALN